MSDFKKGEFVIVLDRSTVYQILYCMDIGCGYVMNCGARFAYSMIERKATPKEIEQGFRDE